MSRMETSRNKGRPRKRGQVLKLKRDMGKTISKSWIGDHSNPFLNLVVSNSLKS